jgi:hypothetical protein
MLRFYKVCCPFSDRKRHRFDLSGLNKTVSHLELNEYSDSKLKSLSSKSSDIPINAKLFFINYNGELNDDDDLNPYKHLKGFQNLIIDKLNSHHNINQKSVAIGRLIQESSSNNQYAMYNCSTLSGSTQVKQARS